MATSDPLLKGNLVSTAPKSALEVFSRHELEITGTLSMMALMGYVVGVPLAEKCLFATHAVGPDSYGKGRNDVYFVGFWVVAFTFLRAASMRYMYHPLTKALGIQSFAKRQRLAEQGFLFTYYAVFWTAGMTLMYNSPYWFDTAHYWIDYPHLHTSRGMKYYYLMQMSFWFQQLYTIHTEKRRKDHLAMVTHHVVTLILLITSYIGNFIRVGNAVLCCMDVSDILLATAKILKYMEFTTICDVTFGLFALSWPITRHGFFTVIVWSTLTEPNKYIDMKWEPEKGYFMTPIVQKLYTGLFMILNIIMIYWFAMIIKVITRVLQGNNAEDTRSDNEEDDHDEMDKRKTH